MDNSEVHYLTYDPDSIYREMQMAYVDAGGDVLYPGDEKEMLLRGVQSVLVQAFAGVDNALRMATLRYASGSYLDILGENRGCSRIEAARARTYVQISFAATGEPRTYEAGSLLTADGNRIFRLTDDLTHSGAEQTLIAQIEALEPGEAGNRLTAGTQMQMMAGGGDVERIYVGQNASGGNDREKDEAYRRRIQESALAAVTTGPRQRYIDAAMAASSRVIDASAETLAPGMVNVTLLTDSDEAGYSVREIVAQALNDDSVRPLTDNVLVNIAQKVEYLLDVMYSKRSGTGDISAAVAAAVADYQNWQERKLGRPFNPDMLTVRLYEAGCQKVLYNDNSNLDGKPAVYTDIDVFEICRGRIVIREIKE